MGLKLVIIGGGSSYTPEVIEGVINRYESFPVAEIILVDIAESYEKLRIIGNLSIRMIAKSKHPIKISWTLNRREAFQQATFIITQIRVGGLKARSKDEHIPLSHGFVGQETTGAGGIFKAFRTIPVLMEIAEEVQEICPKAWIINFTNPAGIVTEALLTHSRHKKVIGVCNIPYNMRHSTAEILTAHPEEVSIQFLGLNHFIFGNAIYVSGINKTNIILEKMMQVDINYSPANIMNLGWSEQFIKSLQLLPNPYHQYYFQTEEVLKNDLKEFNKNGTRAEVVMELEKSLFNIYKNEQLDVKPKELEERGGAFYSEVACSLMDSIYNNKRDIQTVNTVNNGTIPDLPPGAVIEVNSIITKYGPKPIVVGKLPSSIKGLILQMKACEELIIKASLNGNYDDAYMAMLMNPLVADERETKNLLDEMLEAHKNYLPQFKF